MRPRELVAALIVVVGGTLWLFVADRQGSGSLGDRSVIARWYAKPNSRLLAAWFLVENRGPDTITLKGARIASALPDGTRVLGERARIGRVATVDDAFPGPPGPFLRLQGFEIPTGRGATIGFGLALPARATVTLDDVRVIYEEDGDEHELRAGHTARICVAASRRDC